MSLTTPTWINPILNVLPAPLIGGCFIMSDAEHDEVRREGMRLVPMPGHGAIFIFDFTYKFTIRECHLIGANGDEHIGRRFVVRVIVGRKPIAVLFPFSLRPYLFWLGSIERIRGNEPQSFFRLHPVLDTDLERRHERAWMIQMDAKLCRILRVERQRCLLSTFIFDPNFLNIEVHRIEHDGINRLYLRKNLEGMINRAEYFLRRLVKRDVHFDVLDIRIVCAGLLLVVPAKALRKQAHWKNDNRDGK